MNEFLDKLENNKMVFWKPVLSKNIGMKRKKNVKFLNEVKTLENKGLKYFLVQN